MDTKKAIILGIITTILIAGVAGAVVLVNRTQDTRSKAQTATGGAGDACQPPGAATGVLIEFPYCQEGSTLECSFTQASCSWDTVTGAVSYNVKITHVETGTVVDNKTGVTTTRVVFPVIANNTYQCDVTAISSCGSSGSTGTDSLLCAVSGTIATPAPSAPPRATPPPTPIPTPKPTPPPVAMVCGQACDTNTPCQGGLVCAQTAKGQAYCTMPNYQTACVNNPSFAACCSAPLVTLTPGDKPPGSITPTLFLGLGGLIFVLFGGASLMFQGRKRK